MSNLTDFFPSGGGGGLTPKFEEFNSSGTFTPTQALIDAGGYIEVFLVAGGSGGRTTTEQNGGQGGEAQSVKMYLTNTSNCSVTIGAGGIKNSSVSLANGGDSVFSGAAAGGITVTSVGGKLWNGSPASSVSTMISPSWGGIVSTNWPTTAGPGVNGYGMGGASMNGEGAKTSAQKPNSGQGGISGNSNSPYATDGASGYCLIKWYE